MDHSQFKKTLIDTIRNVLEDNIPVGFFTGIYYGDPLDIPASMLPCISIEPLTVRIEEGPTGMDKIISTIAIKLMYNKKNDFGKSPDEVLGIRALETYAQAVNETTNEFDQLSIVGILRKNFTLGDVVFNQTIDINYGITPRQGREVTITAECQIKVQFTQHILVSGRR